jgi:hypothetical protein
MVLQGKRCYISGPIEHDDTKNWRVEPKKVLKNRFGLNIFDPNQDPKQQYVPELNQARDECDFDTMERIARPFVRKDLAMVDRSDVVVACLPYKVCTTGTKDEIKTSWDAHKPTLIVCPQGKQFVPAWYYGYIPHKYFFGGFEQLYDYLQEVVDGKHKDDFRWAFVYGLI